MSRPVLVSACLLGLATRYDGTGKENQRTLDYLHTHRLTPIPVCPEQLAGLPTPRPQTSFRRGDGSAVLDGTGTVINCRGEEMNAAFIRGAEAVLAIARRCGCDTALLKQRSPSCGAGQIYRNAEVVPGDGVATALLRRHGVRILSEEDL